MTASQRGVFGSVNGLQRVSLSDNIGGFPDVAIERVRRGSCSVVPQRKSQVPWEFAEEAG